MRILGYRTSNDEAVTVADGDFRQHAYVIGASGSGKTTFIEALMAQDIAAGRGFCFIDKHGDSAKRISGSH
jgi:type IV secretory pathway VirB4 component